MWKGALGCEFSKFVNVCSGNGLWEELGYMDTLVNRDCQLALRNDVKGLNGLKGFTDDALIS